uniref:Uncharacterized protein LOC100182305 n=1 Tax=Phallusia mammillata TaxID=59560 RepID=A0A6F9DID6_9ASCI|nr:uncharacterized protein LOC100182305 [Phallusia mammillata]
MYSRFLLACLCINVCFAADLLLSCNNACSTGNGELDYGRDYVCNVTDGPMEFNTNLKSATNPSIQTASWYINKRNGIPKLAINLTWSISGHIAAAPFQHGYKLYFNVDSAHVTKTFTVSYYPDLRNSLHSYEQVIMNYDCLGVDSIVLTPGKRYVALMQGIPYHAESPLDHKLITIPDCDSSEFDISETINCQKDKTSLYSTTKAVKHTTAPTIHVYKDKRFTLVKITLTVAAPLLVLIVIIGLLCHCKNKAKYSQKTVLVVANASAVLSSSNTTNCCNQLIEDVKSLGCKVVYSLWHETSITSLGCLEWFHKQLQIVDCVIFIFCQQTPDQHQYIPIETDALFDTFDVGLRVMRKKVLEDFGPLVLAVHFDKKSALSIPDIFCKSNMFAYPKQSKGMLRKIVAHPIAQNKEKLVEL